MKRLLLNLITAVSALAAIYSCTDISSETDATGYININIEKDIPKDIIYVKSAEDEEDFVVALAIYDKAGKIVEQADDYTSLGTITLHTGSYRAVATAGKNVAGAGFDSPYYRGEKSFTVKRGQVSNLDIVCKLANIKVTAELSDDILDKFSIHEFKVTGNDGSSLVFRNEDDFSKDGYFSDAVTEFTWSMNLTSTEGIKYKAITGKYTEVKPGQHYKFKFTLVYEEFKEVGGAIFTIKLDDSVNQKDYNLNLDFGKKNPTISSELSDLSNISHYEGDPCNVSISSETEISSLTISHNDQTLENAGLKRSVELAGASQGLLDELAGIGIVTSGIQKAVTKAEDTQESASIDFSGFLNRLPKGQYTITLNVANQDGSTEMTMKAKVLGPRPVAEIKEVSVDAWAMFANVSCTYEIVTAEPSGLSFQYREEDGDEWTEITSAKVDKASRTFSAEIRGLQASHNYVIKAVSSDAEGPEKTFKTENAATVPNLNFDDWYSAGGDEWYPGVSQDNCFWDTANGGSKTAKVYPTVPEEYNVISGKAAKLESKEVKILTINLLAAGNIYTGKFGKAIMSVSNPGAELDWGIPFTSRPLALKGYYDYKPKAIDKTKAPYEDLQGTMDTGQIQILLTDWTTPFRISTQSKTFVDINDSHIIAYGTMDLNETAGYQEFTINIEYRDKTRTPSYIVIVASASKLGDYFTGGVGSTLYLDEFELVYDPAQLD